MQLPIDPGPLPANPLVSVMTANYNFARFLPEAIESVRAQTYANWEMIICDDGSADDSREVMEHWAAVEPRVRCVFLAENSGHAAALNTCFAASRGEIICLLDADDTFFPRKIESVVRAAESAPNAGMLVHSLRVVRGRRPTALLAPRPSRLSSGWLGPRLATNGWLPALPPCSGLSLRRLAADTVFPIPPSMLSAADCAVQIAGASVTLAAAIPAVFGTIRVHGANATSGRVGAERLRRRGAMMRLAWQHAARVCDPELLRREPLWVKLPLAIGERLSTGRAWGPSVRELRRAPGWSRKSALYRFYYSVAPRLPPEAFAWVDAIAKFRYRLYELLPARGGGPG